MMEILLGIVTIIVGIVLAILHFTGVLKTKSKVAENNSDTANEHLTTKELLMKVLTEIGCQPKTDGEMVVFDYQGGYFKVSSVKGNDIIWIYHVGWAKLGIDHPDVKYLKEAINKANEICAMTTLYTIEKDTKCLLLHSHMTIYFNAAIPNIQGYLTSILHDFFLTQHTTLEIFEDFSKKEK